MPSDSNPSTLVIVVLKARHLHTATTSRWTKQSPYITLTLADQTCATPPDKRGGQHPAWDCELRFPLPAAGATLYVECRAQVGLGRRDRLLGDARVEVSPEQSEMDGWIPLRLKGVQRGEVYLELTAFPHDAAMLATPRASRLSRLQNDDASRVTDNQVPEPSALSHSARVPAIALYFPALSSLGIPGWLAVREVGEVVRTSFARVFEWAWSRV